MRHRIYVKAIFIAALTLSLFGCANEVATEELVPTATRTQTIRNTESPQFPTSTAWIPVTATEPIPSPSPATDTVTLTVSGGNLNIRRGPGFSFNPIGALKNGQRVTARGRDVLAEWVFIEIPGSPGKTGWVSVLTDYSSISGNIIDLPEVTTDFAVPAYARNCTYHSMTIQPGDIELPSLLAAPNNRVRVYPGEYTLYDTSMDHAPEVMNIYVKEGSLIDIMVDGASEKHKCP